ncbi:MAG TPA: ferritin family protein [Patescibacteria group bacterium]|nr:ferritin family protein [Patescibacteria group bacterium]
MNIYDFALKMESDGEQYYRQQAAQTKYEKLKVVLEGLADDEQRHYKIVQQLQNQNLDYIEPNPALNKMRNVFELGDSLKKISQEPDSLITLKEEQWDVYQAALRKEEESVKLYKKLKESTDSQAAKDIIEKLIQEEESHAEVLDKIIEMLNNVNEWVESAEFNHQKPY